jgi:hypothetical protein
MEGQYNVSQGFTLETGQTVTVVRRRYRYHHSPALHEMQENSDEQCYRRSAIFKVGVVFFLLGTAASKDRLSNGDLQILFP